MQTFAQAKIRIECKGVLLGQREILLILRCHTDVPRISNNAHVAEAVRLLAPFKGKRIGFLGVTFKPGTDDLRESPTLDLMATLDAEGEALAAYDPNLDFGPLLQGQIDYVRHAVPRQARLVDKLEAMTVETAELLVGRSDVVVVSHATDEFRRAIASRPRGVHVLDLARLWKQPPEDDTYQGIAW